MARQLHTITGIQHHWNNLKHTKPIQKYSKKMGQAALEYELPVDIAYQTNGQFQLECRV